VQLFLNGGIVDRTRSGSKWACAAANLALLYLVVGKIS